jgi:Zn-dependent protease with chaperone function
MLKFITNAWSKLKSFAHEHIEYVGILVALTLLMVFPRLIRWFDPSAAPIDPGILSGILLAVVAVLIFLSVTWWIIRSIWTFFCTYSENDLVDDFKKLTAWQKVVIYLGFYLALASFFLLALVAIL